jgi:hypothetical protein
MLHVGAVASLRVYAQLEWPPHRSTGATTTGTIQLISSDFIGFQGSVYKNGYQHMRHSSHA